MQLTHASFFSGVGGTDLGLEAAGWRTVSFSEIDPYANAVLAERWPGVPNLGDITALADGWRSGQPTERERVGCQCSGTEPRHGASCPYGASLWSGGFPCQDLSVAGKRAGFGLTHHGRRDEGQESGADAQPRRGGKGQAARPGPGDRGTGRSDVHAVGDGSASSGDGNAYATRSSLAFAFLDLVERHRPAAVLLENVPGLLSSHRGRDMATLLGRLAELGYGVAYRILDARHFGVPQRRRRVFILGLRCDPDDADGRAAAERAAAVLSVGTRCGRHPATGHQTGAGAAEGTTVGAIPAGVHGFPDGVQEFMQGHFRVVSPPPDPDRVRAPDGLAGRLDDLAPTLRVGPARPQDGGPGDTVPVIAETLNSGGNDGGFRTEPGAHLIGMNKQAYSDDPLLPLGLDSHRYRCCGNGVVAPVAEWIGRLIVAFDEGRE